MNKQSEDGIVAGPHFGGWVPHGMDYLPCQLLPVFEMNRGESSESREQAPPAAAEIKKKQGNVVTLHEWHGPE